MRERTVSAKQTSIKKDARLEVHFGIPCKRVGNEMLISLQGYNIFLYTVARRKAEYVYFG